MRAVFRALLYSVLTATWLPAAASAAGPPPLAHNPFSRPPSEETDYDSGVVEVINGSGPTLALRATMVGAGKRLANVAGRILAVGDDIDGYRLVAIHEDYAIFERAGKVMTVYVKPRLGEDDE